MRSLASALATALSAAPPHRHTRRAGNTAVLMSSHAIRAMRVIIRAKTSGTSRSAALSA